MANDLRDPYGIKRIFDGTNDQSYLQDFAARSPFVDTRDGVNDVMQERINTAIDGNTRADIFDIREQLTDVGIDTARLQAWAGGAAARQAVEAAMDPTGFAAKMADKRIPQEIADSAKYGNLNILNLAFATAASQLVLFTPSVKRTLLVLQNTGGVILYVNFGSDAGPQSGLTLGAGVTLGFDVTVPQDNVFVAGAAGGGTIAIAYINIDPTTGIQ